MYVPKHFEQNDPEVLRRVIEDYPLAALIANPASGLCANHIPLRLVKAASGESFLQGHIAKSNDLWSQKVTEALAVFQGADTYISPSFYPTKKEHGKVVPTWNYVAVHVSGQIRFIDNLSWKMSFLESLTDEHESGQDEPWAISDAPATYTERMMEHIVGLEISVDRMLGKWKLSQNRSEQDKKGVLDGLAKTSDAKAIEMASVMTNFVSKI